MADTKMIEGMVEQIEAEDTTKKGRWGSVKVGGVFYKYSDPQYRDAAWNPPTQVGQTVKVRYSESAYIKQDGSPGITRWVSGIETVASEESPPREEPSKMVSREPFRSPSMLNRTEALKLAVEALGSPPTGGEAQYGAEAVALASQFVAYIEGDFDGG